MCITCFIKLLLSLILAASFIYIVCLYLFVRLSKHIQILSVDEFEKQLAVMKEAQLIDVRTPREFKKYRIAGAKNIDYLNLSFHKEIKKLDTSKPVMVYCQSGYRSKIVLPKFCRVGFKTVYELNPGFSGWLKTGKNIEK